MQAASGDYVPNLNGRVSVARDEDAVAELHAGGERLVAHEGVAKGARLDVPHADARVQRAADHVRTVKLQRVDAVRVAL